MWCIRSEARQLVAFEMPALDDVIIRAVMIADDVTIVASRALRAAATVLMML